MKKFSKKTRMRLGKSLPQLFLLLGLAVLLLNIGLPNSSTLAPSNQNIQNNTPQAVGVNSPVLLAQTNTPKQVKDSATASNSKKKIPSGLTTDDDESVFGKEVTPPSNEPWVSRRKIVSVKPEILKSKDLFRFNPYPEYDFHVLPTTLKETNPSYDPNTSSYSMSGYLTDSSGSEIGTVILTVIDSQDGFGYNGRFSLYSGETLMLQHIESGETVVDVINDKNFPACGTDEHAHGAGNTSTLGTAAADVDSTPEEVKAKYSNDNFVADVGGGGDGGGADAPADGTTINVLVAYTPNSRIANGGAAGIQALVQNAVNAANTAYSNSGVSINLNLTYTYEVGNNSSGSFSTDLSRLSGSTDSYMDEVHAMRDTYGADMVALIINNTQYCGMAWLGSGPTAGQMFSVTHYGCAVGYMSFAHELGHNMGAMHDRNQPGSGKYPYSYGYHFGNNNAYRTVMAYAPGTRVAHFSSPLHQYAGWTTGVADWADNARTLNNTKATIAAFRGPVHTISGTVTHNGTPLSSVTINGGSLGSKTTNASGQYTFSNIAAGTNYTLTASRQGYSFSPVSAMLAANAVHNFSATVAPTLNSIGNRSTAAGNATLTIALSASDPDGDSLTFSATLFKSGTAHAIDLTENFDTYHAGSNNYRGANEKYLTGNKNGSTGYWYYILPNGKLYQWGTSIANSTLIAELDVAHYTNPATLINASPVTVGVGGTATITATSATTANLVIDPDNNFTGSIGAVVSVSDGIANDSETIFINVANQVPVLTAIGDITISSKLNTSQKALSATDADGHSITFTAQAYATTLAYTLNQQHKFTTYYPQYNNARGANEKYVTDLNGQYYLIYPNGNFYRWVSTLANSVLLGNIGVSYHTTPTNLLDIQLPVSPSVSVSIINPTATTATLLMDPNNGFQGQFVVSVTASDGFSTDTETFNVNVKEHAPVLGAIGNKSSTPHANSFVIPLSASDVDGDVVTFSVTKSPLTAAYGLDQEFNFSTFYPQHNNARGASEKYVTDASGAWYFILPSGAIYSWGSTIANSTYLDTLETSYYTNPTTLINVPAPVGAAPVTTSVSNTGATTANLTVDPNNNFVGSFSLTITASDGSLTDSETIKVSISNSAPQFGNMPDYIISPTQNSKTISILASDPDGDSIAYSVSSISTYSHLAYTLDQANNFVTYYPQHNNARAAQEKYLTDASGKWYFILPNGNIYRWVSTIANSTLLDNIGSSYYANPATLINVANPSGPAPATGSINGSTLTLTRQNNYLGVFFVTLTASDGYATDTTTIKVSVINSAPVLAPINDQVITSAQNSLAIGLSASDLDANPISYSASIITPAMTAYGLDQIYNFWIYYPQHTNSRSANEKYLTSKAGQWFFILPDGRFYKWKDSIAGSTLIGTLDATYHANPTKLINAPIAVAATDATFSFSGSTLTITRQNNFVGMLAVTATATDSNGASDSKSFKVTITNQAPVLAFIGNRNMAAAQTSLVIGLSAADNEGNPLTYSAETRLSILSEASQIKEDLSLSQYYPQYNNARGIGEKYMTSTAGSWYYIISTGAVYQWGGTLAASTLVDTIDTSYYNNPQNLIDAPAAPSGTLPTANIVGSTLTLTRDLDFVGDFRVIVSVSDGVASDTETFNVSAAAADEGGGAGGQDDGSELENSDTDGDGVSDQDEITQGTDPFDAGSFIPNLESPIFTLWNSFLGMVNILELVNPDEQAKNVFVSLYAIDGTLAHRQRVAIPARSQFDLIVNDLTGFVSGSYGIVKLEFDGIIDGRMMYYRNAEAAGEYDFAFGVPLSNANFGTTAVGFNTFQPSLNAQETNNSVDNWLTIVNLASEMKVFTVATYDQGGVELAIRELRIPAFGRVDIDGGHGIAGASVVGVHSIKPSDNAAPYIAQLIRYGRKANNGYDFAFPMVAKSGTSRTVHVSMSRQFGEDNWVEVINTVNQTTKVTLQFVNANGETVDEVSLTLPAFSQRHFNTSSYLEVGEIGTVIVKPTSQNSIIAESMFYFRDQQTLGMSAMFGSQAREALGRAVFGSYNMFLGMENWLRVMNNSNSPAQVEVTVNSATSARAKVITLPANGSALLAIHQSELFGTVADSYGTVEVRITEGANVFAELIRVKATNAEIDFALPTTVR